MSIIQENKDYLVKQDRNDWTGRFRRKNISTELNFLNAIKYIISFISAFLLKSKAHSQLYDEYNIKDYHRRQVINGRRDQERDQSVLTERVSGEKMRKRDGAKKTNVLKDVGIAGRGKRRGQQSR